MAPHAHLLPRLSAAARPSAVRTLTTTTRYRQAGAAKDKRDALLDRDAMDTRSTEVGQTGGGDSAAAQTDSAFDPRSTDPDREVEGAAKEQGADASPVNVSPGNRAVNQGAANAQGGKQQGGGGAGAKGGASSGAGAAAKNKKVGGS